MKLCVIFLLLLGLAGMPLMAKEPKQKTKKSGVVSKVKDAAARGYGFQLGKEAAKETIKTAKKMKDKVVETAKAGIKKEEKK